MSKRDATQLDRAINFVENSPYRKNLSVQIIAAKRLLEYLWRLEQLKNLARARLDILNMDQMTIAEIKSYTNPPVPVHLVMLGTCILIGEDEHTMQVCHLYVSSIKVYTPYLEFFIYLYGTCEEMK